MIEKGLTSNIALGYSMNQNPSKSRKSVPHRMKIWLNTHNHRSCSSWWFQEDYGFHDMPVNNLFTVIKRQNRISPGISAKRWQWLRQRWGKESEKSKSKKEKLFNLFDYLMNFSFDNKFEAILF